MKRITAAAMALLVLAPLCAESKAVKAKETGPLAKVYEFVKKLNRQERVSAVAAVRASTQQDSFQGVKSALLASEKNMRNKELSTGDEAVLRKTYRALAVSFAVESASYKDAFDARQELRDWKFYSLDGMPRELSDKLSSGGIRSTDALMKAGWENYALGLSKYAPQAKNAADMPDQTVRLYETIDSLQRAMIERVLPDSMMTKALYTASVLSMELSKADFSPVKGKTTALSAKVSGTMVQAQAAVPAEFSPSDIYKKSSPAVVLLICSSGDAEAGNLGSGSIIDAKGLVLTNAHVVIQQRTGAPYSSVKIFLKPSKMTGDQQKDLANSYTGKVLAYDQQLDLALVKIANPPQQLPALGFAQDDGVSVGDRVAAIGHPEQAGFWTLTTGIVSSVVADAGGVKGKDVFQTDASINRGNSGGPLLDAGGNIIGVNTMIARRAADGLAITGINFAIKADVAENWLSKSGVTVASAAPATVAPQTDATDGVAARDASSAPKADTPTAKTEAARKQVISESKPFKAEDIIAQKMREMDDLENEMRQEIEKRRTPAPATPH